MRRMTPGDPDRLPAQFQHRPFVVQEARRLELAQVRLSRKRVAGDGQVVVAEDREDRLRKVADELPQPRLSARVGQQVTGDRDEVGPPLPRPLNRAGYRSGARRGDSEMEVREMDDPQPIELDGQLRHVELAPSQPHPTRFEEPPSEHGAAGGDGPLREARCTRLPIRRGR
jgi:hypothetical protein